MSRILVTGMMAGIPYQGGLTWVVLQYVLGLRRLGHDVWFIEPVTGEFDGKEYFQQVVAEYGLTTHAALLRAGTHETIGVRYEDFPPIDILLNISGMLADERLTGNI